MENKAMYLSTNEERESGSMYEEVYDGHNLSKLNLCDEVCAKRRRKQDQHCSLLNSLSAIKYAIVSLYVLVLLTIFGLCLAALNGIFALRQTGDLSRVTPPLARNVSWRWAPLLTPLRDKGVRKWMDG